MESTYNKWPLYAKLSSIIVGLLAFFYILYIGKPIIVPLIFSVIIAILLNPLVNFLCRIKINRIVAIMIAVLLSVVLITGLFYFIVSQASMLSETWPQFKEKFVSLNNDMLDWISGNLKIEKSKITAWFDKTEAKGMDNSSSMIGGFLSGLTQLVGVLILLPVYIFMILFYKPLLLEFISQLFKDKQKDVANEVLLESKSLIQSYLIGLLMEAVIVAVLNAGGLLILGIQYAILIGVIGALLNMIPYIGGLIAISIPMLIALATKEPAYVLYVLLLYLFVQFVDNNIIVPRIVASKVKINALVSIVVVLTGGALWGVAGMFLSIPIIAIMKVIFDRVPALKPFGFLIGDNQPQIGKFDF